MLQTIASRARGSGLRFANEIALTIETTSAESKFNVRRNSLNAN